VYKRQHGERLRKSDTLSLRWLRLRTLTPLGTC
jgi:hypothetical protein